MERKFKGLFLLVGCLMLTMSYGQTEVFEQAEKNINALMSEMMTAENDTLKYRLNEMIKEEFRAVMFRKNAHRYSFENLENISVLSPKDKKFKIITWHLERSNETYVYSGYIHFFSKEVRSQVLIPLLDFSFKMGDPKKVIGNPEYWYGMLYYDIVTVEKADRKYYTLLAWDGNDAVTDKKIVDVLWFDNEGAPRFGAPLFISEQGIQNRFVLEYNQVAAVRIDYDEKNDRIIFDDVQPIDENSFDVKKTFIPTLSYHALKFDGKMWKKVERIEVRNLK